MTDKNVRSYFEKPHLENKIYVENVDIKIISGYDP